MSDAGGRTRPTRQVVAWRAREHGVRGHPDHPGVLLHRRRFGGPRPVASVAPERRDPDADDAEAAALGALKQRPRTA